jgi:hypothetical protein
VCVHSDQIGFPEGVVCIFELWKRYNSIRQGNHGSKESRELVDNSLFVLLRTKGKNICFFLNCIVLVQKHGKRCRVALSSNKDCYYIMGYI